jgi:hypothetical protein
MEENKSSRSIYDTNVVAALLTEGQEFSTPPEVDSNGRVVFPFPDTREVNQVIVDFYAKKLIVSASLYAENLRMVKALISSTRRDGRGGAR